MKSISYYMGSMAAHTLNTSRKLRKWCQTTPGLMKQDFASGFTKNIELPETVVVVQATPEQKEEVVTLRTAPTPPDLSEEQEIKTQ
jgi:hypothetical protein